MIEIVNKPHIARLLIARVKHAMQFNSNCMWRKGALEDIPCPISSSSIFSHYSVLYFLLFCNLFLLPVFVFFSSPFLEGVGEYSMLPVLQRLGVVYDF